MARNPDSPCWAKICETFHLDVQACKRLKELGCRKYQLSLDGLEATRDRFRKPGSYRKTLRTIECLRRAGIWVAIMSTVSSANAAELPDLIDLVADLEADVFAFGRYCPASGQKRDEFHIEPLAYRQLLIDCQKRIDKHESDGCKTYF